MQLGVLSKPRWSSAIIRPTVVAWMWFLGGEHETWGINCPDVSCMFPKIFRSNNKGQEGNAYSLCL